MSSVKASGAIRVSSATPYKYCDLDASGVRKSRKAARLADVGSFQYFFFQYGWGWQSILVIWIHGTLEISAIVIAGGAGLGALIIILRGTTNIRDVIAFPKTQSGGDLMCGSPSPVDEKQLKEVHIRMVPPPVKG